MRGNPLPEKDPSNLKYAGDNFVKWTGEAPDFTKMQVFAWNAADRGVDVNLQADPTRAAMLHREFERAKDEVKQGVKQNIIEKYGGAEYLEAPPKELLLAQTEHYVEYSRSGKVIRGQERQQARSKYDEDNYEKYSSGHTAVWGSFFDPVSRKWGYACCRATYRRGFCTGRAGVQADREKIVNPSAGSSAAAAASDEAAGESNSNQKQKTLADMHMDKMIQQMKERKRKAEEVLVD
jgi:pre-mRNA-processing factor SLU7